MLAPIGWRVEPSSYLAKTEGQGIEVLRWQDSASPLSVWQIGPPVMEIYRLRYESEMVVDVMPKGRIVSYHDGLGSQISIDHFIADQVFPRLLAHLGSFVIHGGAVQVDAAALIFLGNSGRGKSTLVASFDRAGFALLGDDAMVLSSLAAAPRVRAVYRSLRLFPDSIDALIPNEVTAGPMAHYSTKQRIDVAGTGQFNDNAIPARAFFTLGQPSRSSLISLRRLTPAETCMALIEGSFALDPADRIQARRRLEYASGLACQVPAYEISYPRNYARLPDVRDAILNQVAALQRHD